MVSHRRTLSVCNAALSRRSSSCPPRSEPTIRFSLPCAPALPDFPGPSEQLDEVRRDFELLRGCPAEAGLPQGAAERAGRPEEVLAALLDPGRAAELPAQDPEGLHVLSRAVRRDVPEAVDAYARTRWWSRLTPGQEPPEAHPERRLTLLDEEVRRLADTLRETEARRQESPTRYLEDRSP